MIENDFFVNCWYIGGFSYWCYSLGFVIVRFGEMVGNFSFKIELLDEFDVYSFGLSVVINKFDVISLWGFVGFEVEFFDGGVDCFFGYSLIDKVISIVMFIIEKIIFIR